MKDLTKIEEILLLSIWELKDNAYGLKSGLRPKPKALGWSQTLFF